MVVPRRSLARWGGLRAPGHPNDFDRACSVSDYLGTIRFDTRDALVLGDDPFPTAFVRAPSFGGGYLVRMLWGDDLDKASLAAHRLAPAAWSPEPLLFDAGEGDLVLFDAAQPGEHAQPRVEVGLGPGRYSVASADWEDDEMCLLIHRLVPIV